MQDDPQGTTFWLFVIALALNDIQHIETMDSQKEEDRDEAELVKNVKPLLEQAEKILNETYGAIKGADPDNRLSNKAQRNQQDHKATPAEQRLAEAIKVLVEEVGGTIDWAKDKLDAFPKAKKGISTLYHHVVHLSK